MSNNSFGFCRSCGKQILWIRTKSGKNMPVDPTFVNFKKVDGGKERIVLPNGEVIAGERCEADDNPDGHGYISHFATCPNADSHRRR